MPAVSVAQRRYFGMIEHDPSKAKASGMSHQQLHDFAATPDAGLPEHAEQGTCAENGMPPRRPKYFGQMAESGSTPEHWQQGAVKRPGALTVKANRVGESPMQFAHQHYHSSGLTGQQARYAVNAQKRR